MLRLLLCLFLLATNAQAALTLVQRETFQAVGTLNGASPGNLGTIYTGGGGQQNFYKRAVGPRVNTDTTANSLGWSADTRGVAGSTPIVRHDVTTTSTAAATLGTFSCWYYFNSFSNNGSNKQYLSGSYVADTNQLLQCILDSTTGNFWYNRNGLWTDTNSTVAVPLRQWFELRTSWQNTSANNYNVDLAYRLAGSSTWVTIYSTNGTPFSASAAMATVRGGAPNTSGSQGAFVGRYGMPSLYGLGSYTDKTTLVGDVIDPTGPITWYINPSTGNDNNDGVTSSSAWAGVDKFNTESANGGLFASSGYATGDTVNINTTSTNLTLGTSSLKINTRGLNIVQIGGGLTGTGEIQAWKTLTNGSFTGPISGTTKVYQITDAEVSIVVWENDKWLNHPTGANLAAVQSTLDSTAGSFWTDGTTLYVHPFGDTNPTSDGKTYTRSIHRNAPNGDSAIQFLTTDCRLSGLRVRKTCLADKSTNDTILAYGIHSNGGGGGISRFENCYVDYTSKHGIGFTDNSTNRSFTVVGCQVEQQSPYGSQTPYVDYSSLTSALTNSTLYDSCISMKTKGLIGSTAGVSSITDATYITHNNGGGNAQFSSISFNNCNFAGGGTASTSAIAIASIGTTWGGGWAVGTAATTWDRCYFSAGNPIVAGAGGSVTANNCIFVITSSLNSANTALQGGGTLLYRACIFDASGVNATSNGGLFVRTAALNLTLRNCVLISTPGADTNQASIVTNAINTDTLVTDHCIFQGGGNANGFIVAANYNDGSTTANRTLTQWKTLALDTGSASTNQAALLDTVSYKPLGGSPAIRGGVNIGPLTDYAGLKTFTTRDTIGAYQFSSSGSLRIAGRRF